VSVARVFLVGFMGAGKTVVGRALAERTGFAFVDTDAAVVQAAGMSIEEIFRRSGEGAFREAEWRALCAIADSGPAVVATGGGLFLGVENRRLVRRLGRSVWLDVPLAVAAARVPSAAIERPLWSEDPLVLRALFERRRAAYALADARVDAGRDAPEAIASLILSNPCVFPPEFAPSR
jgi:shikimate kinase